MALTPMQFNPVTGLLDTMAYVAGPATETAARQQVQGRLNELRDYLNNTLLAAIAAVTDGASGADLIGATAIAGYAGATVQAILESVKTAVDLNTAKATNATHTGEVTGSGALTIADAAVTYAKMQHVSATDKLLGRSTALAGDVEEIACTAAGRALLDDATAAAQLITLGVNATAAELNALDGITATVTELNRVHNATATAAASLLILRDGAGRAKVVGGGETTDIAIMGDVTSNVEDTPVVGHTTKAASGNAVATHLADTLPHLMAQSKAANGYVKLPGGVIIQWGVVAATTGDSAITYPIAFPNAATSVQVTMQYSSSSSYATIGAITSKTGFTLYPSDASSNGRLWVAIGY